MPIPPNRFYVYTYAYPEDYPDSQLSGTVFYVGKGQGHRIDAHEREARNGGESRKCRIIRQIWDFGKEVVKTKVQENMSEQDAYALECELIRTHGRENLVNNTDGGEGAPVLRTGTYNEYHILIPEEDGMADTFEYLAKQQGGIVAYVERLVRQDIATWKHQRGEQSNVNSRS